MNTAIKHRTRPRTPAVRRKPLSIVPLVIAFLAVAAALAVLLEVTGGDEPVDRAVEARQYGAVAISGEALPPLAGATGSADPAIGQAAPRLAGADFDSTPATAPSRDRLTLLVFAAHWCPHCQAEIPRVVDWMEAGGAAGVDVVAVSTAVDPKAPNWTPEAWLERERWAAPVVVDDSESSAGVAYGVDGYPFFTLVGPDGTVVWRASGEIGTDVLTRVLDSHRG